MQEGQALPMLPIATKLMGVRDDDELPDVHKDDENYGMSCHDIQTAIMNFTLQRPRKINHLWLKSILMCWLCHSEDSKGQTPLS